MITLAILAYLGIGYVYWLSLMRVQARDALIYAREDGTFPDFYLRMQRQDLWMYLLLLVFCLAFYPFI
jgi:hypothetical protein